MNYSNLRDKTAFDYCTDAEAKEWFLDDMDLTKEEYLKEAKNDALFRALGLMDVADAKEDDELMSAVERDYSEELRDFFDSEDPL